MRNSEWVVCFMLKKIMYGDYLKITAFIVDFLFGEYFTTMQHKKQRVRLLLKT